MGSILENLDLFIIVYIVLINLVSLLLFRFDKQKSKGKAWRISERTLLFTAFLGGSIGGLMGMNLFKHKTKKRKFVIGLPLILIVNIICLLYLINILSKLGIDNSPPLQLI